MLKVSALDHLVLTVADIPRSVAFYTTVLGMSEQVFTVADGSTRSALRFGDTKINLHAADAPFAPHAETPLPGSADLCLITSNSLKDWATHFRHHQIPILEGPVPRSGAKGPITSLYVRDPDFNLIEISTYD